MLEDNEEFKLIINTDMLPNGVTTDRPSRATVIIRNDDGESDMTDNALHTSR